MERAESLDRAGDSGVDLLPDGNVGYHREHAPLRDPESRGRRGKFVRRPCDEHDIGFGGGKCPGQGQSKSAAGAGDQGGLASEGVGGSVREGHDFYKVVEFSGSVVYKGRIENMTTTKWLFVVFVLIVVVERALETNFSRKALRGQKHMSWSLPAFFVLHVGIIAGMTVEFFAKGGTVNVAISVVGLAMFAGAMWLRLVAIRTLDKFWSLDVEIREGHKLVRHGVYAYMRHPVYSAIILEFVGMNLVANAYWTLLATVLLYFPLLGVRLVQEEKVLIEKFGDDYRRYREEVRAVVPIRCKAP